MSEFSVRIKCYKESLAYGIEPEEVNCSGLSFVIHSGKLCADTGVLNGEVNEKDSGKDTVLKQNRLPVMTAESATVNT
jgi:hypothetical protein